MKKVKYLIITCISFALLSYGVIAFANGGTNTDSKVLSHGDVTGKFVAMVEGNTKIKVELKNGVESYPLDGSIWVFRDQKKTELESLKSGDKLELILNSNKKVTYIKAFSDVYLIAEAASVSITTTLTPTPTAIVTAVPSPTPTPTPTVTAEPSPTIIVVNEDSSVVIETEDQKQGDDHDDGNDNLNNEDNNSNDDHHDGNNEQDNQGQED